ncbi:MAG: flavin reductase family protein [bacterium]|nr:flavin reductase family protein [bacterium]
MSDLKDRIGKSLGRIPSGVAILTAQHGEDKGAMLASWFQQCSFEPPMVSVAMKKGRSAEGVLQASEKFVLNILHTNQKDMLGHFGKGFKPGEDPFAGIETETQETGLPILKKCLCFLECQVRHIHEGGDHQIIVGEVINAGAEEDGQPMVHLRRSGFTY